MTGEPDYKALYEQAEQRRRSYQSDNDKLRQELAERSDATVVADAEAAALEVRDHMFASARQEAAERFPHADVESIAADTPEEFLYEARAQHRAAQREIEDAQSEAAEAAREAFARPERSVAPQYDTGVSGAIPELTPERFERMSFAEKLAVPDEVLARMTGSDAPGVTRTYNPHGGTT